jgi:hypothetical protein
MVGSTSFSPIAFALSHEAGIFYFYRTLCAEQEVMAFSKPVGRGKVEVEDRSSAIHTLKSATR